MSSNAQRLADAVLARRDELAKSQLEVWQAGGPSNTTLTTIENGLTENLTNATAKKLDRGLEWTPGSARAVWLGGEPTRLEDTDQLAPEVEEALESLTPEQADKMRAVLLEDRRKQLRRERGTA